MTSVSSKITIVIDEVQESKCGDEARLRSSKFKVTSGLAETNRYRYGKPEARSQYLETRNNPITDDSTPYVDPFARFAYDNDFLNDTTTHFLCSSETADLTSRYAFFFLRFACSLLRTYH